MRNILYFLLTICFISLVICDCIPTYAATIENSEIQISDTLKVESIGQQKVADNFLDSLNQGLILYTVTEIKTTGRAAPIKSVPDVLTKCFPNVTFFHNVNMMLPETKTLYYYYCGKQNSVIREFNLLYRQMNHDSSISLIERIEALLLAYLGIDNRIKIESIEENNKKIESLPITFNFKVTAAVNDKIKIYLLSFENDTIVCITEIRGETTLGTLYYESHLQ